MSGVVLINISIYLNFYFTECWLYCIKNKGCLYYKTLSKGRQAGKRTAFCFKVLYIVFTTYPSILILFNNNDTYNFLLHASNLIKTIIKT